MKAKTKDEELESWYLIGVFAHPTLEAISSKLDLVDDYLKTGSAEFQHDPHCVRVPLVPSQGN